MKNFFLLEEELREFAYYDNVMRLLPWQRERWEREITKFIAKIIRKKLCERNPMAFKYIDSMKLYALATEIASKLEMSPSEENIVIMSYDLLMQARREQPGCIKEAGKISEKTYFALIHQDVVGVFIPKTLRQLEIEKMVSNALEDLESFLKKAGVTPNIEISNILSNYLMRQSYSKKTKKIKIYAEKRELEGEYDIDYFGKKHKIQMVYDKEEGILHYHIV